MSSAFYPGAGLDIFPPIMFRHIKNWIYMDSQPGSEFGDIKFNGCERSKFIEQLKQIMVQNEFTQKNIDSNTYTFYNSEYKQTIRYETNSVFPHFLKQQHYDCDTLVLCGFSMDDKPLGFINKYSHIITNNITCHDLEDEELLLSKKVSTMIINKEWEYWETKNQLSHIIHEYVNIVSRFITYIDRNIK